LTYRSAIPRFRAVSRIRVAVCFGVVISLLSAAAARAQAFRTASDGLNVGHFLLYPSISIEYTHDDNITFESRELPGAEILASGVMLIKPRILMDLPIAASRIRWVYSPLYRDYTNKGFPQTRRFSHFFDFEAMRSGPLLSLRVADRYVKDTVQLREADRGGEVFGLVPFTTHAPELQATLGLGARSGVSLIPRYTAVSFQGDASASFFGYRKKEVEVRLLHAISPATEIYAFYSLSDTNQDREVIIFGDVSLEARSEGVGFRRVLNQDVVTYLHAGYKTIDFKGGANSDFAGPVLDANATWQLGDATMLNLSAAHQAYQSFFVNNNYYVDTEMRLEFTRQIGHSVYWNGAISFTNNHYADPLDISVTSDTPRVQDCEPRVPDPANPGQTLCGGDGRIDVFESYQPSVGRRRRDHVVRVEIGAGWQVARAVRLFLGYNSDRRTSNIEQVFGAGIVDPFDYRVNRVVFRIEAGWM